MEDNILVTGGTGFIGSHTCISLLENNFNLTIVDSNINSSPISIKKVKKIFEGSNFDLERKIIFEKGDIRDKNFINKVFLEAEERDNPIKAVIHFAGLKAVRESVDNPLLYWDNNVLGSLKLFEVMKKFNCKIIVFSSSATVYGNVKQSPILESFPILPENTYGHTKAAVESILQSLFESSKNTWRIANLRYFNPIGAHKSGLIGEAPNSIPNNIFPILCNVALRKIDLFSVYGNNWETKDGTCIRDYIHVMDLAESHTAALNYLLKNKPQCINLNIGTGIGTSVFELISKFQNVVNGKIPYSISDRRQGDVPILVANNLKAMEILKWHPKRNLDQMCIDGWNFQQKNPNGFDFL